MAGHRLECQDKDECVYQPCGLGGKCINLDYGYGWQCQCPERFTCTNCSCSEELDLLPARSFGITSGALAIILACLFAYLSKMRQIRPLTLIISPIYL